MTRVHIYADVAELADALDSGSSEGNFMWVQVPSSAPGRSRCKNGADFFVYCFADKMVEEGRRR